jgi:hypothetical protein
MSLPQQYENLSTEQFQQFRLYCDGCHDPVDSERIPISQNISLPQQLTEAVEQLLRQCPQCSQWVCRENCWEAIRCLCERCARPSVHAAEVQAHQGNAGQMPVYNSILGGVCPKCQMVLDAHMSVCPECGSPV